MRFLRRHGGRLALTLLPVLLALAQLFVQAESPVLERLDHFLYDTRLRATMPGTPDDRVVVVDIDERSLAELGRWPWSRDRLAGLTRELFDRQQAAVVGFDVLFSEPDDSSGLASLRRLALGDMAAQPGFADSVRRLAPALDHDRQFADALRGRPVVLGYYFSREAGAGQRGVLPPPVMARGTQSLATPPWTSAVGNLPALAAAAPQAGFMNSLPDGDGVVRSVALIAQYQGQYYESLALAMYRSLHGQPALLPVPVPEAPAQLAGLQLGRPGQPQLLPVDARGATLVPYRGPGGVAGGSFRYLPAVDVIQGRLPAAALAGKLVLVGTTAPGLLDLRVTPVGNVYPGVETHANILSMLLDGRSLVQPDEAAGYTAVTILLAGLVLALGLPLLGVPGGLLLTLCVLAALVGLDAWLYLGHGLVMPLALPLLTVLAAFAINISYGYFVETRSKRQLARLFGTYVPRELVKEMLLEPGHYSMRAENRELTVMFCDMRGFTTLCETMEPQAVQALLNTVFSRLTEIIRQQRGTVDKYMGDCVMAFWGAPVADPAHARRAVRAALDMSDAIRQLNQEHAARGLPAIGVGIGLNTGIMCVGDMGSDIRRSYTVIGDAVNLASRLESLCRSYGVEVIASETTRGQAADECAWRELDRVQVRGRQQPVTVSTPLRPAYAAGPAEEAPE